MRTRACSPACSPHPETAQGPSPLLIVPACADQTRPGTLYAPSARRPSCVLLSVPLSVPLGCSFMEAMTPACCRSVKVR